MSNDERFLLDSSIWIHLARGRLRGETAERIASLVEAGLVATNEVIRLEVLVGSRDRAEFERNTEDFSTYVQLRVDGNVWDRAAELGFQLLRQGVGASLPDVVIAATAIQYGIVLMHADRGLNRISGVADLRLESHLDELAL